MGVCWQIRTLPHARQSLHEAPKLQRQCSRFRAIAFHLALATIHPIMDGLEVGRCCQVYGTCQAQRNSAPFSWVLLMCAPCSCMPPMCAPIAPEAVSSLACTAKGSLWG